MKRCPKFVAELSSRLLRGTEAAALMEFAVALPLLVVIAVGVFDFGAAFNLKQKLNNAAREGARYGSIQPTNDLFGSVAPPASVEAVRFAVDSYLLAAGISDCGLATAPKPGSGSPGYAWTYSASSGCGGQSLQLTIQRALPLQDTSNPNNPPLNILCTQVSLSYPFQWHFNNVIQLLIPGAHLNLLNIKTQATAVNTD